jgi:hypothetical protein
MASSLFGKYAVMGDLTHHFELEPDWYWKIKPVTAGMELEMSKFLAHRRIISTVEGRAELPPTALEIGFREIALTFGGTNVPKMIETNTPILVGEEADVVWVDSGDPILKADAKIEEIEKELREMPRSMLMEIWRAVGESYPYWGPADPNQE